MSSQLIRGIYYISNVKAPVVIDMLGGDSKDGARIGAWWRVDPSGLNSYHQLWFIEPVDLDVSPYDTQYTIRNLRCGSYIDLENTISTNNASLVGRQRGGESQHWFIRPDEKGAMRICNSVTGTYVNLNNGNSAAGTTISGWEWCGYGPSKFNQLWILERVSRSSEEIHTKLVSHPGIGCEAKSYQSGGVYLILPRATLSAIYSEAGLKSTPWRRETFDCDDFAFALKTAVSKWGNDNLGAEGFGILCGVIFGRNSQGARAFNWMLSSHLADSPLLFFDPRDGTTQEGTHWDYKSYFGIF